MVIVFSGVYSCGVSFFVLQYCCDEIRAPSGRDEQEARGVGEIVKRCLGRLFEALERIFRWRTHDNSRS